MPPMFGMHRHSLATVRVHAINTFWAPLNPASEHDKLAA